MTVEASVDGGPFGPPPATITGDGVHIVDMRASNGGTATLFAPIDTTPPEIVLGTPANGGVYTLNSDVKADYFCRDSGSGVVTPCTGTVADGASIDTSTIGTKSFTVNGVTDAAGHSIGPRIGQLHGRLPPDSLLERAHGRRRHLLGEFQRHKPRATDVDVRARRAGLMVT